MRRLSLLALPLAALVGLGACSARQRTRAETAVASAFISDQQEAQLGAQVKQQLEQKEHVRYVTDPQVVQYVQGVSNRVLQFASRDRRGVQWKVHVIDDPKTVNAFATPGGYLYVYTGLLLAADNEAELAGVMGHEAGHVVGRHSARAMVQAFGLQTVLGMALGQKPNQLAAVAANLAGGGAMLAHGRGQELEADEYGVRYTALAGYDPRGLVTFFQKLQAKEGRTPGVLKWLSTHPPSAERVQKLDQTIAQQRLSGSDVGAERLAAIKPRIRR